MINDPTQELEVVSLREHTLADPQVNAYINILKAKRIGLVLSGGGGKGAYEAGVLLGLFDCGIRKYCALSGTSVGALNAALCHESCRTGDRDTLLKVWGAMSWRKVFAAHPMRVLLAVIGRLLLFPSLAATFVMNTLAGAIGGTEFAVRYRGMSFVRLLKFRILREITGVLPLALGTILGFAIYGAGRRTIAVIMVALFVVGLLSRPFVARYLALVSNAPLRAAITCTVDANSLWKSETPVFITMTGQWRKWDDTWSPIGESRAVLAPTYADLRQMEGPEMVLDCLLQSAAIPEAFPARRIYSKAFIDGGLIDNTPILPVCLEKPEVMIVVYLDSRKADYLHRQEADSPDLLLHEQARTFWLFDLVYRIILEEEGDLIERSEYRRQLNELLDATWAIRLFSREQFFPLIPTMWLGGFFQGTLNFSAAKANALIRLGYCDTLKYIKEAAYRENDSVEP